MVVWKHKNKDKPMPEFKYYNDYIKAQMKEEPIYDKVINQWQLKDGPYGIVTRTNKAGIKLQRDRAAQISMFDKPCFYFYLMKYCEVLGVDILLNS